MFNAHNLPRPTRIVRGHQVLQNSSQVPRTTPHVQDFGAGVKVWEQVLDSIGMLRWSSVLRSEEVERECPDHMRGAYRRTMSDASGNDATTMSMSILAQKTLFRRTNNATGVNRHRPRLCSGHNLLDRRWTLPRPAGGCSASQAQFKFDDSD